MAYQIKCDSYILYDPRDDELSIIKPKFKLQANTVGSGSFTILKNHPYYANLQKLKSVFELNQDGECVFRGRMTGDSRDLNNRLSVDLEGVLAFTNDSIIPPFKFPEDFAKDAGYIAAAESGNVIEFFAGWILEQHNSQVQDFQKLKLGRVTVTDPNNFLSRSSENYDTTWNTLKSKLFGSALGGFLSMRYENDGNYVDFLADFDLTNTQEVTFGENVKDIVLDSEATETYSAILPFGAKITPENGEEYTLTLESLPDGDLNEDGDLVKKGNFIYSKSAVEQYGWICVPISESTWGDVKKVENLKKKAMEKLSGDAVKLKSTITFKAVDLHFTDEEIQSFRVCRNVIANLPYHGIFGVSYQLTKLDIDVFNPQNTVITAGLTVRTMTDINEKKHSDTIQRVEIAEKDIAENRTETSVVKQQILIQTTQIMNDCEQIILSALESYVETGDYESFKSTVESQLSVLSNKITMDFNSAITQITNVNGDLQKVVETLEKHFDFSIDGMLIKAGEGAMELLLDNDVIRFRKNGVEFGWWDGVNFHTGNIFVDVDEIAQFGNYGFVPFEDEETDGLDLVRVGG